MDYNIFKDEKEQEDARQRLPELEQHPGWKYIVRALDLNYAHIDDELNIRRNFDSVDEIYTLLDRRNDLRKYKELPILLLQELQTDLPQEEDSADPYPTPKP